MNEEIFDYIREAVDEFPQLCHAKNLLGKLSLSSNTSRQQEGLNTILVQYHQYLKRNIELVGFGDHIIEERVKLLNEYYNFFHVNEYDNLYTSQSKFRPTILEEFMFLLFKDYIIHLKQENNDEKDVINSGSAKAYTNLYFTSPNFRKFVEAPEIEINLKDQDFAIYRDFDLKINDKEHHIRIPIVAIENKTYIDKTMLEGIIATAEKIKNGNPYSRFIVVSENYDVDLSVDPAYSRVDQIYVLRKCKRKETWADIDERVVKRFFKEVKEHIQRPWSDVESKMRNDGIII